MTGERRLVFVLVGVLVALPLLSAAAWYGLWVRPAERRADALGARFEERLDGYRGGAWRRPVLRGKALSGNAAVAASSALLGDAPRHIDDALRSPRPLPPEVARLADREAARLARLRLSTHYDSSFLAEPLLGATSHPQVIAHLDSLRVLLALARTRAPSECLQIGADALRLAQDMVPGGGVTRVMMMAAEVSLATRVIMICARQAAADALERAARELESLARHAPPLGPVLETEDLASARHCQALFEIKPWFPALHGAPNEQASTHPLRLLDAWQLLMEKRPLYAQLKAERYPEALDELGREIERRDASPNPLLHDGVLGPALAQRLMRDAEAQARVRAAALALGLMAEARRSGQLPAALPEGPGDPFRHGPLGWQRDSAGGGHVYSVGPNRRDQRGHGDDVAVEVLLETPANARDEPLD